MFAFQIGPWTLWLGIELAGRFPDIDRIIPTSYSKSTLQLAPADARFLVDNLPRLPSGDTNRELTLDLNGSVILRASSPSSPRPTELVLRNSSKQGVDVRICTDRKFLARAAEQGFAEISLPDNLSPAVARDATRIYLWMLLDPKEAIQPTPDCLRIESPLKFSSGGSSPRPTQKARVMPLTRIATRT
ncbi:beta clamp domain-containing protein [Anatilimnocola aggregata]|uniref:hypothetical protein n=1 Tax=Anatilimnocola aggregata TaxID=2528021 RepID=UPI0011AAA082|nr:hypothetical protein [Anatilimnocola aggregata]